MFEDSTFVGLLAEACRQDDEGTHLLLGSQVFYILRTIFGRHNDDGQVGGRQLLDIMESLDALHLVFLGIDDTQRTFEPTAEQVANDGAARFMHIVTAADDDNTLWL